MYRILLAASFLFLFITDLNFGGIGIGESASQTTPVELSSFSATRTNISVVLRWETATEINNFGFEIQRREALTTWQTIAFIKGAGNSNSPKQYSFTDLISPGGNYSYRLKQIDFNGKFKFSKSIDITSKKSTEFEFAQNYPNPFNPTTTIKYSIPSIIGKSSSPLQSLPVQLIVTDLLGRKIATLVDEEQAPGNYSVIFNAKNLSGGIYFYTLTAGEYSSTKKMLLIK